MEIKDHFDISETTFFYIDDIFRNKIINIPVARQGNKQPVKRIPQNFMKSFHERKFMTWYNVG